MSNNFQFQVVALDRYTKVFRDLNNKATKAVRPLVNVQRQAGALAKEMHLDKVAKGLGKVSEAAVGVSRTLGLSLGPLESLLGAGGVLGGLALAAGGALALGVNFARSGFEVGRTSQAIGVSARDLQQWRGAAQLAGVDAEAMTQALTSMGRTLQDARFGRDPVALQLLRQLGIGIPTKNGIVDQVAALEGVARALSRISDPQTRATLADALHIPPEAVPALLQGVDAMAKLRQKAQDLGVVIDEDGIQKANEFTTSLNLLKVAAMGASNAIGARFAPTITSAMDALTKRTFQLPGNPLKAIAGVDADAARGLMRLSGVTSLFEAMRDGFRGPALTAPEQRHVAGVITGAGPAARAARGRGNDLSASETASLDDFTPAERARQQADEDSASNRRELLREISRTRDPAARTVLQNELTKIDQRLQVEVTLRGAPPGSSASARVVSSDAPAATARVQFAMPAGDMP